MNRDRALHAGIVGSLTLASVSLAHGSLTFWVWLLAALGQGFALVIIHDEEHPDTDPRDDLL